MEFDIRIEGETRLVDVRPGADGGWVVCIDGGEPIAVAGGRLGTGDWALSWGGIRRVAGLHQRGDDVQLQLHGRAWSAKAIDARKAALQLGAGGDEGVIATQMPGVVVRLLVAEGDEVEAGDPVVVVEAMKMENEFKATISGRVSGVHVDAGQAVESGAALVTVEPVG